MKRALKRIPIGAGAFLAVLSAAGYLAYARLSARLAAGHAFFVTRPGGPPGRPAECRTG